MLWVVGLFRSSERWCVMTIRSTVSENYRSRVVIRYSCPHDQREASENQRGVGAVTVEFVGDTAEALNAVEDVLDTEGGA